MVTYTDRLMAADRVYKLSADAAKLKKTVRELDQLFAEISRYGQEESDLGQDVASLGIRVKCKALLIAYADGGYYADDLEELELYAEQKEPIARGKGWRNTADICVRVKDYAAALGAIMQDAVALIDHVRDSNMNALTSNEDELRATGERFAKKAKLVPSLPDVKTVFGERVVMPDISGRIAADIAETIDWCERNAAAMALKKSDKFFLAHVRELSDYFPEGAVAPEIFQAPVPDSYTDAGVIVINTAFEDEALFCLFGYTAKHGPALGVVNGSDLCTLSAKQIKNLFDAFLKKKLGCVVLNVKGYHSDDDRLSLYTAALDMGRSGGTVYLVDSNNDRAVYEDVYRITADEGSPYSITDVADVYLRMPPFSDFSLALENAGLIEKGVVDTGVKDKMMFAGYIGLNAMLDAAVRGDNWRNLGIERSAERYNEALDYLSGIPSQIQFLDLGWGEFRAGDTARFEEKRHTADFDYDDISYIDRNNLKKIVENPRLSIFEKCGGVTLYAMVCGMDKSVWSTLSLEEKSERLTVATHFVSGVLCTRYRPEVKIVTKAEMEKDAKGAGGLCIGGGKRIHYREDCVQGFGWTLGAICHECYHAFQHSAISSGWKRWHWEELGVTEGRIDRWNNNFNMYDGDVNSVTYKVEVVESDAVAFEKDCSAVAEAALRKCELN